ncbi:MAG: hypothetical protein PHI90_03380 [Clostridia bacterium]|nr:hypothetical protein [Clostridia bacterium]MDD4047858.1 hypothetical protein [Clostridia bacterium]
MSFPVTPPVLTQAESVNVVAEAEAGTAQCLADMLCNTLFPNLVVLTDVEQQAKLIKTILCAYSAKESSIGNVLNGLASKILADKGLVPGGNGDDCC